MTFTKIGLAISAVYLIALEGIKSVIGQLDVPLSNEIIELLVSRISTIIVLTVGLYFSWKHHINTINYYRTKMDLKDEMISKMDEEKYKLLAEKDLLLAKKEEEKQKIIALKDEEIKRLNYSLSDRMK